MGTNLKLAHALDPGYLGTQRPVKFMFENAKAVLDLFVRAGWTQDDPPPDDVLMLFVGDLRLAHYLTTGR